MVKRARFQTRMDPGLKAWFQRYARKRGGMSLVFTRLVQDQYKRVTGREWSRDGTGTEES